MPDPKNSPTIAEETERLKKWREVRRKAAADPATNRQERAATDRETRLDLFEKDKARRIRDAEERRRDDAEAIENRRMEKARIHLEALDDIETAKKRLLAARQKSRQIASAMLGVFVGLPTLATAIFFAFIAEPVFQSTSIFALDAAHPVALRNPLFADTSPNYPSNMAPAFQLRAQLSSNDNAPFEVAIDQQQGLLTLTTFGATAIDAANLNHRIITRAETLASLRILAQPTFANAPNARVFSNTILMFLTSLSLFAISAIFIQSILHHSRN